MKIINLEAELNLCSVSFVYSELKNKQPEKGDLIQKNKKNIGVVIKKDSFAVYVGSFNEEKNIFVREFSLDTYAEFYSTKGSGAYSAFKNIIEKTYQEITQ